MQCFFSNTFMFKDKILNKNCRWAYAQFSEHILIIFKIAIITILITKLFKRFPCRQKEDKPIRRGSLFLLRRPRREISMHLGSTYSSVTSTRFHQNFMSIPIMYWVFLIVSRQLITINQIKFFGVLMCIYFTWG